MKIVLVDLPEIRQNLLPLTFTRPISDVRVGILKISEKWSNRLRAEVFYATEQYLESTFKSYKNPDLLINASVCPNNEIVDNILKLNKGEALFQGDSFIAANPEKEYEYEGDL